MTATPRPWVCIVLRDGLCDIFADDYHLVATKVPEHRARLIVRAVNMHEELVESLRMCVDALGAYLDPKQNPTQYTQRYEASLLMAHDVGEAALAKAKE